MYREQAVYREYILKELNRYWSANPEPIRNLPMPIFSISFNTGIPQIKMIKLPYWASDLGVEGELLVPDWAISDEAADKWQYVDWIAAAFWLAACAAEQEYEQLHGCIHSYAYRLTDWDQRLWERAWVNRIALFLRRWAARENGIEEDILFGQLPKAEIYLTHDVDAVQKTVQIRLKQAVFCFFNAARYLKEGNVKGVFTKLKQGARFLSSNESYCFLDEMARMEAGLEIRSTFLVYGRDFKKDFSIKRWLIDPSYDIQKNEIKEQLKKLYLKGWKIGLHQSYDSWQQGKLMQREKERIENTLGIKVNTCRQHWLRFSWLYTWAGQQEAGIAQDVTLGFNDRMGFRNAAAVKLKPFIVKQNKALDIEIMPMVLMDSHLYDYGRYNNQQRIIQMKKILDEVRFVRGQASILWHPHTLSKDYGWCAGYEELLGIIGKEGACAI